MGGDVRQNHGYSITDERKRAEFVALVASIRDFVAENSLEDRVVFHGTSASKAAKIIKKGMKPTEVDIAISYQSPGKLGSFWGTVDTAAAYADDTVHYRDEDSHPVILAIPVEALEAACRLYPDGATLDCPLDGLTKLSDPDIAENWQENHATLSWHVSLKDLGAIVAEHKYFLKSQPIEIVDDPAILKEMMGEIQFRP